MANIVLDSYAMLAFFRNEPGKEKVEQLLNETAADKHNLFMSCINAGEVYYMASRKDGAQKAELVWKALQQFPIEIIEGDLEFTFKAAQLKSKYKISFADAFAAALGISKKAVVYTGDKEFENIINEQGFRFKYL